MKVQKMTKKFTPQFEGEVSHIGKWPKNAPDTNSVPVYHVSTFQAFNRIVGYAKFINGSNGTVLYRGQCDNHDNLLPSGARDTSIPVSDATIDAIRNDKDIVKFFKLNDENITGWERYQNLLIESILQHYGAQTYCMDFVDNHWCALWFGLYRWENKHYKLREDEEENLYIYLYLADTNGACIRGVYIGEDTYTVDLRKALPSTAVRPAAQHGWIVRKHRRERCHYNDNVIGVLEINVKDAYEWIGGGAFLSQKNFFPSYTEDQGYKVLLTKQFRSGVSTTKMKKKTIPASTIRNYHYPDSFYVSDANAVLAPVCQAETNNGDKIETLTDLYTLLLEEGWSKETCFKETFWNEDNVTVGQSGVTALLVQKIFGGEIFHFKRSKSYHYFNRIGGYNVDLTFDELPVERKNNFPHPEAKNLGAQPGNLLRNCNDKLNILIEKCGLNFLSDPVENQA